MNAYSPPVDLRLRDIDAQLDELCPRTVFRPIGHDAPKHSVEWSNYEAACIAAREVRGKAIHSETHRLSLEAWERGERSWPWPDPSPEQQAQADDAVRGLVGELLAISRDHRRFNRTFGRR